MGIYVRSRTFLCCLTVRIGVFVMSLLSFLFCLLVAVVSAIALHNVLQGKTGDGTILVATPEQKLVIWILTVFFSVMAFVHLIGFIGSLSAKRALVLVYSVASWTLLLASIGSGAYALYRLHHVDQNAQVEHCVDSVSNSTDTHFSFTETVCQDGVRVAAGAVKLVVTLMEATYWVLQFYACHIISSYAGQLKDQERSDRYKSLSEGLDDEGKEILMP